MRATSDGERAVARLAAGELKEFLAELGRYFRRVADPKYREFGRRLKGSESLGVRAPVLRKLSAAILKMRLPEALLRRTVTALWRKGGGENRALALLLIQDHWKRRHLLLANTAGLRRFAEDVKAWDLADSLGSTLGMLMAGGAASLEEAWSWTRARSAWVRRMAAVAGGSLFQHDRGRLFDALSLIEPLLADAQRDVRLGVQFSLRNIARRSDPSTLLPQLEAWAADAERAPAVRPALRVFSARVA